MTTPISVSILNAGRDLRAVLLACGSLLMLASSVGAQCLIEFEDPVSIRPGGLASARFLVVDLDEDADLDIITNDLLWVERTGPDPTSLEVHSLINDPDGVYAVRVGDVDGDADLDVIYGAGDLSRPFPVGVYWLENDGQVPFTSHTVTDERVENIEVFDLDGDGDLDIILSHWWDIFWMESDGQDSPSFTQHLIIPEGEAPTQDIAPFDLDQDGDMDVLAGELWAENIGGAPPSWKIRPLGASGQPVDIDGDGDLDLASASGGLSWYENSGELPPQFTQHVIPRGPQANISEGPWVADVDGDGDPDLVQSVACRLCWHYCTWVWRAIWWFENSGDPNPTFTLREVIRHDNLPWGTGMYYWLGLGDWTADGDIDVIACDNVPSWHLFENLSTLAICSARLEELTGDGLFQPGEPGVFNISLYNQRIETLSNVDVAVSSQTPGLTFDFSGFFLGDVALREAPSLQFPFTVDDSIACGASFEATVDVTWDGGSGSQQLMGNVGERVNLSSQDSETVELAIPDNDPAGVSRTLTLSAFGGEITGLTVTLDLAHAYRGDLLVTLTGPGSVEATLFDGQPSDSGQDLRGTFPAPAFVGELPGGSYTLRVVDRVNGDAGTLHSWGVSIDYEMDVCVPWQGAALAAYLIDALLGLEPMTSALDVNSDGAIDAADLVTALDGTP